MKTRATIGIFCALVCIALCVHLKHAWKSQMVSLQTHIDIPEIIISSQQSPLQHLACIMDGNRRWATQHGLAPWEGHREGITAVRTTIEFCLEKGITYLTLYVLSPENLVKRSEQELQYLFELIQEQAQKGVAEFQEHGIRISIKGDRSLFPAHLIPLFDDIEKKTEHLDTLQLTLLFCYGGRQEIVQAVKTLAHRVKEGTIDEDAITPELVNSALWLGDLPDPDLIIRTGKVSRLSNFLLYQAAYSEIYMIDAFWPEITKEHLQKAYDVFLKAEHTFGA